MFRHKRTTLLNLALGLALFVEATSADYIFGTPTNLGPVVNSSGRDAGPSVSADGLSLFFASTRSGGFGGWDIWMSTRATADDDWGVPANLGPNVNSSAHDTTPSISADGLSLFLLSERSGGLGGSDIWVARRATTDDDWGTPVNLGPPVNTAGHDGFQSISSDGLELYFFSNRPGGYAGDEIWVTKRETKDGTWSEPVNLGGPVNSPSSEASPNISSDGLALFFHSDRPGGHGGYDIWVARRTTTEDAWSTPVNLGPTANTSANDLTPGISPDGSTIYFSSWTSGGQGDNDLWQVSIAPIVDFNGDSKVDEKDMGLLADNWGKNTSLCDIGPFAWGDGVVDEKDLRVLMESLVAPKPKASDVPCDVTLSWISPSFANICDVCLGTSREAVNTADRANPQGVLISQGQTATTYDPAGLLELSQTYYWRVDFVIAGPAPTIIKGPVLEFTTAALTYPIKKVTATASSAQAGSDPERTVDGSGLDKTDGHSTDQTDMWWSMAEPSHWIQYEFDKVYTLHEMWVWNMNQIIEPFVGFGAKTLKIEYSTDGTTWTALANVPEFAKAPGKPGYTANTIVSFAGVPAKFVKLTIEKNWGGIPQTGLSEVRFFCIQTAAIPTP